MFCYFGVKGVRLPFGPIFVRPVRPFVRPSAVRPLRP
uniref:Uncharacterized protein n=1 Tax=Caenorhabditis japonica TaxID=281687 RepID=A0A8R1E6D9_CAEJA